MVFGCTQVHTVRTLFIQKSVSLQLPQSDLICDGWRKDRGLKQGLGDKERREDQIERLDEYQQTQAITVIECFAGFYLTVPV